MQNHEFYEFKNRFLKFVKKIVTLQFSLLWMQLVFMSA